MPEPTLIHELRFGSPTPTVVNVRFMGAVARGVGMAPEVIQCGLCEAEMAKLPENRSDPDITIRIGTSDTYVDLVGWTIRHVDDDVRGFTDDDDTVRTLTYRLTLEDARWRMAGDRGGLLTQGVLNPIEPNGQIRTAGKLTNKQLLTLCLDEIPLARTGAIPDSLNDFEPLGDIEWYGAHAPSEAQRLLEHTRHAFAFNMDGTYTIVPLIRPGTTPANPEISSDFEIPSAQHVVGPVTSAFLLVTSAPTRNLQQRTRSLTNARPLEWVGVDTDGSIHALTDLTWWPAGKTPIQVINRAYLDVDPDFQELAKKSIYKMLRLHADDRASGMTLVQRLVDEQADYFASGSAKPKGVRLLVKGASQNKEGLWVSQTEATAVDDFEFNLQTGVVKVNGERLLVALTTESTPMIPGFAAALSEDDVQLTFGCLASEGDHTDYFMAVYELDAGTVIESALSVEDALDLSGAVPVARFDDLQLMQMEDAGLLTVTDVNLTELKDYAKVLAAARLSEEGAKIQRKYFRGLHEQDPNGSIMAVVWNVDRLETQCEIGTHALPYSDYLEEIFHSRLVRPGAATGVLGTPTGAALTGRTSAAGPGSGAGVMARPAPGQQPSGMPVLKGEMLMRIESSTQDGTNRRWAYELAQVRRVKTGYGADSVELISGGMTVTGYNLYEVFNTTTGMTGAGVTVEELEGGDCPMPLRPIPDGSIVRVRAEIIKKADDSTVIDYTFERANAAWEEPA